MTDSVRTIMYVYSTPKTKKNFGVGSRVGIHKGAHSSCRHFTTVLPVTLSSSKTIDSDMEPAYTAVVQRPNSWTFLGKGPFFLLAIHSHLY